MSKATIFLIDDDPTILKSISVVLKNDYQLRIANSGQHALEAINKSSKPDLILLDVQMPDMDGYAVLSQLKLMPETSEIPVIFVTARDSFGDEARGLQLGAVDYITKPIEPTILQARIKTHLTLKAANLFLKDKNEYLQAEISKRMQENQLIQDVSIRALAHLAEARDQETGDHILRTQAYVNILANCLKQHPRFKEKLTDDYINILTKSAPLHDIGKVGIPDEVLLKPGKLNDREWEVMKQHTTIGAQAIENAELDVQHQIKFLTLAKNIAYHHHERWDGSGYPDGLKAEEIPLCARIMAISDVFDALISNRVYKQAFTYDKTKEIINKESGKHFDPDIADAFIQHYLEFVAVADKYRQ